MTIRTASLMTHGALLGSITVGADTWPDLLLCVAAMIALFVFLLSRDAA